MGPDPNPSIGKKKNEWLINHPLAAYLLAFVLGALMLSLLSLPQKLVLGASLTRPEGYIVPIIFGGGSGLLIGIKLQATERAYRQMQESSFMNRVLVERAADGILIADSSGNYLDVNDSACAMLGYSRQEILQMNIRDLVTSEELVNVATTLANLAAGETILAKRQLVRKDGAFVQVEVSARQLPDGRLLGILRDITEREKAALALQEHEERLRSLINASPDNICFKDGDGRWLIANDAKLELFQLKDVDYQGKTDKELAELSPFYREAFLTCLTTDEAAWQNAKLSRGDEVIPRPDGTHKVFDVIKVPLFNAAGQRRGLVVLGRDITERKQAEEAFHQAQKTESLGILAGGVAHDFNNLLVAMLGQTSLALTKLSQESPARTHLEKAVHAAERAADLTRQMLAYSGRGHIEARPINLNLLLEDNLHLFQAILPKNVAWHADLAEELPLILADPGQMQQVIMNLIINSAEAIGSKRGVVTVVTGVQILDSENEHYDHYTRKKLAPGSYVTLEVRDSGSGMRADTLSKIFDPFFTTKEGGRGLGLAAVVGIVRGHHGGLHVYSEVDQGTTFKLLFPSIQQAQFEEITSGLPQILHEEKGLLLVIDDEEPVREAATDIMEMVGIQVLAAPDGEAGVALYQKHMADINLILLDLSMPGMNGEETFRQLQRINPQVRVILTSGFSEGEATRHFAGTGLVAFLQKPFSAEGLARMVVQHLGQDGS